MSNFLKVVDNSIVYTGYKLECMIPDDWFKDNLADEFGKTYSIFGLFVAYHYTNDSQSREDATRSSFEYPAKFYTTPYEVREEKVDIGQGLQKYRVFTYYKNTPVFNNKTIVKSTDVVELLVNMLMNGKLDFIPYARIPRIIQLCKMYNGVNFDVPAMYEETIIAEYYRNPKNIKEPMRKVAKSLNEYSKGINQRTKAAFTSTFSGLTFEDKTTMLTIADNAAKNPEHKEIITDMEKVSLGMI